jgi:CubicO group peptidase (beta-lactamase class C family)
MDVSVTLERSVRTTQAHSRVPALSAALHRGDRPLWTVQVGASGTDVPLSADTLFRIGSVTKTFTAVMVMQCRDEGLLELDDPIGAHLPGVSHGDLTIRRLLSHTSGIAREPYGDIWDTLNLPDTPRFIEELSKVEQVLPTARRFHYSNVGFAILGHLVERLHGGSWAEVLDDRVLRPLALIDIRVEPDERAATGYLVDAYSDHARPEPPVSLGAMAPAGQLWGSAPALARWAAFLADPLTVDPSGHVLRPSTLDEMRWVLTMREETQWAQGFGLGLIVWARPNRTLHIGHDGAMPGFLAGVFGRRGEGAPKAFGAAVLSSSGTATAALDLVHTLLDTSAADDPADIEPWTASDPAPDAYRSILGPWWSEGTPYEFCWRGGTLQARGVDDPPDRPPAVFEIVSADVLRVVSGREAGELLRLTRDPDTGYVVRMNWATYRVTRRQEGFDGSWASEP